MESSKKHFIIVAGEASGDMHAAHLVKEIKALNPDATFSGLGGQRMQQSGVKIYVDLARIGVIGFTEVFKHYAEIKRAFNLIIKEIKEEKPDAVILVDYPGFNLRLARAIKKMGITVIYYISPQVWAWKENRIALIREVTDMMLVLFPFEKELYEKHGVRVECVGHPLVDAARSHAPREAFLHRAGLSDITFTVGMLPGSRAKEIENLLPVMIKSAQIIYAKYPKSQFLLLQASTVDHHMIDRFLSTAHLPLQIISGKTYDAISACDICMVASGTATLETALLQKPMVIIYKTSWLTYALAKLFIKIPYIGLVNVVAGKRIVPECIQNDAAPEKIASELEAIFTNEVRLAEIKSELKNIKSLLGTSGASRRAAEEVLKIA